MENQDKTKQAKERDFADGLIIEVTKVEAKENPKKEGEIVRIEFETSKGRITYKTKTEVIENRRGLPIKKTGYVLFDDLPEKVFDILREVNDKGLATVKAFYQIWNTEQDGEPVTYRYVNGAKMFDKWEIIKGDSKEETVG